MPRRVKTPLSIKSNLLLSVCISLYIRLFTSFSHPSFSSVLSASHFTGCSLFPPLVSKSLFVSPSSFFVSFPPDQLSPFFLLSFQSSFSLFTFLHLHLSSCLHPLFGLFLLFKQMAVIFQCRLCSSFSLLVSPQLFFFCFLS